MAVIHESPVTEFDQWYKERVVNDRTGCLEYRGMAEAANELYRQYTDYKREMDARVANYWKLEKMADAEVISEKPDLPNISSGEASGIVLRTARNVVQHTPNMDVICEFDDDTVNGIFAKHILRTKIIGDDLYSNNMQQHLFASVKQAFTLGFECVIPVLQQDAAGSWYVQYDTIHYRDVFPEPGAKDVRRATNVFVRRYLTPGEVRHLIRAQVPGWDHAALRLMLQTRPPAKEAQSVDHQTKKHRVIPEGYEIITWYSNTGDPFLTFDARTKHLLRIEKNKHPLKHHPVFFLVLEQDDHQPLGKSQVERILGRQEFQDLMLNGAMKLWYRNINPSIIGYGAVNAIPNLSPGKYTQISNPNAKVEAFEVNTQTLLQYGQISTQNAGNMVQLVGAADQQMATMSGGNGGMSATPQGVEAQAQMVDITTNNYQKAVEHFFSEYCSYALTIYFQELKGYTKVKPTADSRVALINAGLPPEAFGSSDGGRDGLQPGELKVSFADMAVEYFVRCVPGSLVEMEDEKQLRILQELFVPLSQAMPALAATQDPEALKHAAAAMRFIIEKSIELSGSAHSTPLKSLFEHGQTPELDQFTQRVDALENTVGGTAGDLVTQLESTASTLSAMQQQISLLTQSQGALLQKLGVQNEQSTAVEPSSTVPV